MRKIFLLIAFLGSLASCSTYHTYSNAAKGIDFKKYKTYAYLPDADTNHGKSMIDNQILRDNIHKAVDGELNTLGLRLDTVKPDVLVLIHTMFEKKQETVRTPLYSSYPYYYPGWYPGPWYPYYYPGYYNYTYINGYDMRTLNFTQGNIAIDMIDRETKNLIWRGWNEENIYDQNDFQNTLGKRIHSIFQKYPVQPREE